MTNKPTSEKETREAQAGIIGSMVFRINGADKKYIQDKDGKKYAGQTLQEIIDHELAREREKVWGDVLDNLDYAYLEKGDYRKHIENLIVYYNFRLEPKYNK